MIKKVFVIRIKGNIVEVLCYCGQIHRHGRCGEKVANYKEGLGLRVPHCVPLPSFNYEIVLLEDVLDFTKMSFGLIELRPGMRPLINSKKGRLVLYERFLKKVEGVLA